MGLGKTLSVISLIATAARFPQLNCKRVLIICPKSTVLNWVDEFFRWIENIFPISLFFFEESWTFDQKVDALENWYRSAWRKCSIMFLGYEAFRNLVLLNKSRLASNKNVMENCAEYQRRIDNCLIDGTELVVLDEGHMIKNMKSGISHAVGRIKTPRRIILTGMIVSQKNLGCLGVFLEIFLFCHFMTGSYNRIFSYRHPHPK